MVKPIINMLASEISHMPLHCVWRDSGVTQKHGFDLAVHVAMRRSADSRLSK